MKNKIENAILIERNRIEELSILYKQYKNSGYKVGMKSCKIEIQNCLDVISTIQSLKDELKIQ